MQIACLMGVGLGVEVGQRAAAPFRLRFRKGTYEMRVLWVESASAEDKHGSLPLLLWESHRVYLKTVACLYSKHTHGWKTYCGGMYPQMNSSFKIQKINKSKPVNMQPPLR